MAKGSGYIRHKEDKLGEGSKYWPSTQQAPLNGTAAGNQQLAWKKLASEIENKLKKKQNKKTLFLFQAWQTHASYNSDPGHRYKLRIIQVKSADAGV